MYTKAIDLDPNNAVYFCNRAAAFSKLDKSLEAIEDCEAALQIGRFQNCLGVQQLSTGC